MINSAHFIGINYRFMFSLVCFKYELDFVKYKTQFL
jgi:hypothetical protein